MSWSRCRATRLLHATAPDRQRLTDRLTDGGWDGDGALIAGQALGMIAWEDVEDLVPVDRTFIPEPHAERVYDRLADELPTLYAGQRGTFARLAAR